MLLLAMVFASVRDAGLNPRLYFDLQMEAGILEEAGISEADLLQLDVGLARYLKGEQDDLDYRMPVFGQMQSAFNRRELEHLQDCRRLFAPVVNPWLNLGLAVLGVYLALQGRHRSDLDRRRYLLGAWLAAGVILLPLGVFGLWAAADFSSAFTCFHKILFTNDLWLLNPATDLLIRICPAGMFAGLGLRIGLKSLAALLGLPLLLTLLYKLEKRKKEHHENAEL